MSIDDLLNITCDIYSVAVTQDSVGGPVEAQTLKHNDLPCRIVRKTGDERTLLGREGVVATHTIYVSMT